MKEEYTLAEKFGMSFSDYRTNAVAALGCLTELRVFNSRAMKKIDDCIGAVQDTEPNAATMLAEFATMKNDLRECAAEISSRFGAAILDFINSEDSAGEAMAKLLAEFMYCVETFYSRFDEYIPRIQAMIEARSHKE